MAGKIKSIHGIYKKHGREAFLEAAAYYSDHVNPNSIDKTSDSAILVEKNGTVEAINLDFVIRIREYPKNKKGKKKSVVLD